MKTNIKNILFLLSVVSASVLYVSTISGCASAKSNVRVAETENERFNNKVAALISQVPKNAIYTLGTASLISNPGSALDDATGDADAALATKIKQRITHLKTDETGRINNSQEVEMMFNGWGSITRMTLENTKSVFEVVRYKDRDMYLVISYKVPEVKAVDFKDAATDATLAEKKANVINRLMKNAFPEESRALESMLKSDIIATLESN